MPALMTYLNEYGSFSGYKLNVKKTQILSFNYNPPTNLRQKYQLKWDEKSVKYLGIYIPKDLSRIAELNYKPLNKEIKEDIHRWSLIPYLSLSSRIESIKMNILPRVLYLFQSIPMETPGKQFQEWDRSISRYTWAGKKPRIRYKILQIPKEEGGLALPILKDYYKAAQLRPLICWCTPSYKAIWKNIEQTMGQGFPISALIGVPSLQNNIIDQDNPWITNSLQQWSDILKQFNLKNFDILKWFAYDPQFTPSQHDHRFKEWTSLGLTTYFSLTKKGTIRSFQDLKDTYGLSNQDHFRYLQIRDYIIKKIMILELKFYRYLLKLTGMNSTKRQSQNYTQVFNALTKKIH